jgi:type I restriction enzyme R subunit
MDLPNIDFEALRKRFKEAEHKLVSSIFSRGPHWSFPPRAKQRKMVSRELLAKLKQLLHINWRQKFSARSQLKLVIEDTLDAGLPRA